MISQVFRICEVNLPERRLWTGKHNLPRTPDLLSTQTTAVLRCFPASGWGPERTTVLLSSPQVLKAQMHHCMGEIWQSCSILRLKKEKPLGGCFKAEIWRTSTSPTFLFGVFFQERLSATVARLSESALINQAALLSLGSSQFSSSLQHQLVKKATFQFSADISSVEMFLCDVRLRDLDKQNGSSKENKVKRDQFTQKRREQNKKLSPVHHGTFPNRCFTE